MDEKHVMGNPGKTLWRDAARDGGVIGAMLFAVMLADEFTHHKFLSVIAILDFAVLAAMIYIYTRKRSAIYGGEGFTFGQSMSYIIIMMLFTGFITGIGDYIAYNYLSPDYYAAMFDIAIENNPLIKAAGPELTSGSEQYMAELLRSPIFFIFSGIFGKVILGGLIGLFASVFLKRNPHTTLGGNAQ